MKLSQFNIIAKDDMSDKYIIYNTHTTACVAIDSFLHQKIFIEKDFTVNEEVSYLYKNGILVDDEVNELELIKNVRKAAIKQNIQNIVILTTTNCNARCYYCFEKGIEPRTMTLETADATIKFIKKIYNDKKIAISWFGGEPLMNFDIIKYFTAELLESGYELEAHVTTNGSLLTDEMIEYFKKNYSPLSFQITIDALGNDYAKIKRYVDIEVDLAFNRTINNVKKIIKNDIQLIIRVNFAASKIDTAKKIYEGIISELKGYDLTNTYIYMAPLTLPGDKEIISNFNSDAEHPFLQVVKKQLIEGFPLQKLRTSKEVSLLSAFNLTPTAIPCGMTLRSRVVVNADGKLYKCHRLSGHEQYSVGDVFNGYDEKNEILKFYYEEEVVDDDCAKCNILPICQEGCKYMRIKYGNAQKCSRIKQIKEDLVRLYYHKTKEKINNSKEV